MMRPRCGFTLSELVVVISIIVILASILLPAIRTVRNSAQSVTCMNIQRQLAMSNLAYATDEKGNALDGRHYAWGLDRVFLDNLGMSTSEVNVALGNHGKWPKRLVCPQKALDTLNGDENYAYNCIPWTTGYVDWDSMDDPNVNFRPKLTSIPSVSEALMFGETDGWYAMSFYMTSRHGKNTNCVFWDGHVQAMPTWQIRSVVMYPTSSFFWRTK